MPKTPKLLAVGTLYEDEFYTLVAEEDGVVVLSRSDMRASHVEDIEAALESLLTRLRAHVGDTRGPALLIDMRAAHPRNDEPFEAVIRRFRAPFHDCFDRTAVLVQTKAGALQVRRLDREQAADTTRNAVFDDESDARAFLGQ